MTVMEGYDRFRAKLLYKAQGRMHGLTTVEDGREHQLALTNTGYVHDEPRRKVSISSDAIQADEDRQRKISTGSHRKTMLNGERQIYTEPGFLRTDHHPPNQLNLDHLRNVAKTEVSWWYLLCSKCRQKETGPGWEPNYWPKLCPYPYCPTYRHVARCIGLTLIVLLVWGIVYTIIGDDAAPGGQLFDIAMLVICAHFGGYVFRMVNLPGLVGMLLVGVVYQNVGLIDVHGQYREFCSILRRIALVIILTRAGLDLDPGAMRRLLFTTLRLGLVPWVVEAAIITVAAHYFIHLPWMWALLTAGIVAAVSPAVIVPCLLRLRARGYGVAKGIPTVVIAISGIDDAASVAAFGIIHSIMFSHHSLMYNIALCPLSIIGGLGFGVVWAYMSKYIPEKGDPYMVPMRVLMLLGGGMIALFGFDVVHLEGAGPLGVVAAAFGCAWIWSTQGWSIEDSPVATAFEIFWMVFEPILFSLTGMQIKIKDIDEHIFTIAITCLVTSGVVRMICTVFLGIGANLNTKEKCFIALACATKASVQAALASVALDTVRKLGMTDQPEYGYAQTVLVVCVLSIVLTAPGGAVLIMLLGPRLLSKTMPGSADGWRRSARPSLRDITVVDEGNEADDIERRGSHSSHQNSQSLPQTPRLTPPSVLVTPH